MNVLKNNNRTLSWSSSDNATWVSVSPTTGSITSSAEISVSVNPAGLAADTYTATVTVAATKRGNSSIRVTLTVTSGSTPSLTTTSNSTSGSTSSSSNTASLTWNPDTSTNLAGYKVYVGTSSGVSGSSINVGNVTSYAVTNLGVGNTYSFAVTAYNTSGGENGFSNEVSKSVYRVSTCAGESSPARKGLCHRIPTSRAFARYVRQAATIRTLCHLTFFSAWRYSLNAKESHARFRAEGNTNPEELKRERDSLSAD